MSSVVCATFRTSVWPDPSGSPTACLPLIIQLDWEKHLAPGIEPGYRVYTRRGDHEPVPVYTSHKHDRALARAISIYKKQRALDAKFTADYVARIRSTPRQSAP